MAKHRDAAPPAVTWQDQPEAHDYPAAASYLSLVADPETVATTVEAFHAATTAHYKAKDILRAARLPLLPETNPHVRSDLAKVRDGKALSPVLIVRGDASAGHPAQIADGYHRTCAAYLCHEDALVPGRILFL